MAGTWRAAILRATHRDGRPSAGQKPPTEPSTAPPTHPEDLAAQAPVVPATRRGAAQDRETAASVPTSGVWGGLVTAERRGIAPRSQAVTEQGGFWPNGARWR